MIAGVVRGSKIADAELDAEPAAAHLQRLDEPAVAAGDSSAARIGDAGRKLRDEAKAAYRRGAERVERVVDGRQEGRHG